VTGVSRPRIVFCNRASRAAIRRRKNDLEPLVLDYRDDSKIRLGLPDFVRSVGTIPSRVLDLMELAGYLFAADRLTARGQPDALMFDSWSRRFHIAMKVRDAKFWGDEITRRKLAELLVFMTGDREYNFDFQPGHTTDRAHLFDSDEFQITPEKPHHVMLFSGGLDSLAGAIERLNKSTDIVCLVSHRSGQPSTAMTQTRLVEALAQRFPGRVKSYRFGTGLTGNRAVSETQRTRTFLYGSIAFALATALGQKEVTFYENGLTSLNFPRRQDLLNARASRTTHPRTMFLLSEFLSHVGGKPVALNNMYRWKTKADVLEVLKAHRAEDLIPSAVTCSRTTMTRGDHTHCGGCFQCVDRRFSASAAGLSDVDHSGLYTLDMLSENIADGQVKTVILDYIRLGFGFEADTADSFFDKWLTEISDAMLRGDREEQFVRDMFGFVNRFGKQTVAALQAFSRATDIRTKPVAGSLLDMIQQQEYLKSESERFAQKLAEKLQRAVPAMFANNRPVNENDFNDKIQGLLQADAEEYRREYPATQFALARVVPDHEFQNYHVLIEAKYIRAGTALSRVTDQIAADIVKYPVDAYIVFAIYDPDRAIRDDARFAADIESHRKCRVLALR
jgi:7-cyano-7-deazaguanine synthase in queuosine biosynthesis